jgi:hypothetical protein
VLLLTAMLTVPPEARIQCRGNFQMTKYGPIATPYCEEEQIAFVARSYGQSVSQVRKNPLMKVYLCQTLGLRLAAEGILHWIRSRRVRPGPLALFGREARSVRRYPDLTEGASLRKLALFAAGRSSRAADAAPARRRISAQRIEKVKKTLTRAPPNRPSITYPRPIFRLVPP